MSDGFAHALVVPLFYGMNAIGLASLPGTSPSPSGYPNPVAYVLKSFLKLKQGTGSAEELAANKSLACVGAFQAGVTAPESWHNPTSTSPPVILVDQSYQSGVVLAIIQLIRSAMLPAANIPSISDYVGAYYGLLTFGPNDFYVSAYRTLVNATLLLRGSQPQTDAPFYSQVQDLYQKSRSLGLNESVALLSNEVQAGANVHVAFLVHAMNCTINAPQYGSTFGDFETMANTFLPNIDSSLITLADDAAQILKL